MGVRQLDRKKGFLSENKERQTMLQKNRHPTSLNVKDPEAHRLAQAIAEPPARPSLLLSRKRCGNVTNASEPAVAGPPSRNFSLSPSAPPPRSNVLISITPNSFMTNVVSPNDPGHLRARRHLFWRTRSRPLHPAPPRRTAHLTSETRVYLPGAIPRNASLAAGPCSSQLFDVPVRDIRRTV